MEHYRQSLVLNATPAAVYAALTEARGLRGWWTGDCDVENHVGGHLQLRFGPNYKTLRIAHLEPGCEVRWHCTAAHIAIGEFTRRDEWVGTELRFRLSPQANGQTRLDFEHIGLVPAFECYGLCSEGWQHFLASLQQYVATGRGTPYQQPSTTAATA